MYWFKCAGWVFLERGDFLAVFSVGIPNKTYRFLGYLYGCLNPGVLCAVQCRVCLCWQHGQCVTSDESSSTPSSDKYVCPICLNPPGWMVTVIFQL